LSSSASAPPKASSTTAVSKTSTTKPSSSTTQPEVVEDETCQQAIVSAPSDGKKDKLLVTLKLAPDDEGSLALIGNAAVDVTAAVDTKNPLAAVALALTDGAYKDLKADPKSHKVVYLPGKDGSVANAAWACDVPKKVVDELEAPESAPSATDAPTTTAPTTLPPKIEGCVTAPTTCTAFCAGKGKTCEKSTSGWGVVYAGVTCGDGKGTPLPCDESPTGHPFTGTAPPNSLGCVCNP
jgi:hypothetical protein